MNFPSGIANDSAELLRRDAVVAFARVSAVAEAVLILSTTINATSTAIAHGLRAKPRACFVLGQIATDIFRSAAPDASYIYLQAASIVVADVLVIP